MRRYANRDIRRFLRAVSRQLSRPFKLVVIGGAAASLSFRVRGGTMDIDTSVDPQPLSKASNAARRATGLEIPLAKATVIEAPRRYEQRLKRVPLIGSTKLQIFVPERHDWALMKMARLELKDIEHIKEVSKRMGFKKEVLLKRFREEMAETPILRDRLLLHFLAMMEELFGSKEAARIERALAEDLRRRSV
jgi:hypothetical protein